MAKVRRVDRWGAYDSLAGAPLRKGERIEVTWPDGTKSTHNVSIEERKRVIYEHGKADTYPDARSYVLVDQRGKRVRCYLAGMEARRLREKTD